MDIVPKSASPPKVVSVPYCKDVDLAMIQFIWSTELMETDNLGSKFPH